MVHFGPILSSSSLDLCNKRGYKRIDISFLGIYYTYADSYYSHVKWDKSHKALLVVLMVLITKYECGFAGYKHPTICQEKLYTVLSRYLWIHRID